MRSKNCPKCKRSLKFSCYGKDSSKKLKIRDYCKECDRKLSKEIRRRKKEGLPNISSENPYIHQGILTEKELRRSIFLKHYYGITLVEYRQLFDKQKGCCAICGIHESKLNKILCVDHCHKTGVVRELLCNKCNTALGSFNDDIEILERAANYIKKHNQVTKVINE